MRPHMNYLKYVLLHKLYVFRAGRRLGVPLWRLIIHDISKFSPSEWGAYVRNFYGASPEDTVLRAMGLTTISETHEINPAHERWRSFTVLLAQEKADRKAAFDRAWLHHQHHNPHHWQHWVLREDDGALKILEMPEVYVKEMVADWIGAGNKILARPTLEACARETAAWYASRIQLFQFRASTRRIVEALLIEAAVWGGVPHERVNEVADGIALAQRVADDEEMYAAYQGYDQPQSNR